MDWRLNVFNIIRFYRIKISERKYVESHYTEEAKRYLILNVHFEMF
jgi:hypothetical protein